MKIISIVPRLPPAIDGVGDYALCLARQLRKDYGIETQFLVCSPTWEGSAYIENFPVFKLETRSEEALLSMLSQEKVSKVILQFSGYGYAKKSCCFWLINGLKRWLKNTASHQLITMFHEVYSPFGMPWKSQFWVSPVQRFLAASLIKISKSTITNTKLYAKMLDELCTTKKYDFTVLPVLSTVGETYEPLPLFKRKKQLIVFGQPYTRMQSYQNSSREAEFICQSLGIEEIIDIGEPIDSIPCKIGDIPLTTMGMCSPIEIGRILQNALAGLIYYDPRHLAKSSVFAGYCAHGLLPINTSFKHVNQSEVLAGEHYWMPDNKRKITNEDELQKIATNSYFWYKSHNLTVQAKVFSELI